MADHLTEEEQIEALKQWWKENRAFIVIPLALVASGYYGWGVWQANQQQRASEGSIVYGELVDTLQVAPGSQLSTEQRANARSLATEIAEDYEGSLYADNANLVLGRLSVEANDLLAAESYVQRVVESGANESIKNLAKARLARIKLSQSKYDDALILVSSTGDSEYKSMFAEIRGDALAGQGNSAAAKTAYQESIDNLQQRQFSRQSILRLKIDGVEIIAGTLPVAPAQQDQKEADIIPEEAAEPENNKPSEVSKENS